MTTIRTSTQYLTDSFLNNSARTGLGHASTESLSLRDSVDPRFYIMKGTIPTQGELNSAPALFRVADRLLTKALNGTIFDSVNHLFKMNFTQQIATQSGLAEWWMWQGDKDKANDTPIFLGSISVVGGGGDMTLTDTNIVSGSPYNIGPASWSFTQRDYTY